MMPADIDFLLQKILIIEDSREIRLSLVAAFEVEDYEVISAESGRTGIAEFVKRRPDLIITDLRLPDMDGSEVTARIRRASDVPIIVLSAIGDEQAKVACLDAGADDYIVKGVGMDELIARARRQLRRSAKSKSAAAALKVPAAGPNADAEESSASVELIRILLVGQSGKEQRHIRQALEHIGHTVAMADSFDNALKQMSVSSPQMVIINMNLRGSSPIRLANYIRLKRIAPVILVVEKVTPVLKAKSRILEVADIVPPSIEENELVMRISWAKLAADRRAEQRHRAQQLKKLQDELKETG